MEGFNYVSDFGRGMWKSGKERNAIANWRQGAKGGKIPFFSFYPNFAQKFPLPHPITQISPPLYPNLPLDTGWGGVFFVLIGVFVNYLLLARNFTVIQTGNVLCNSYQH